MILCHKYKFIFLRTMKTASTSTVIALSKFCGPDDIITPLLRKDTHIIKSLGYRGAQHYLTPIREYGKREVLKLLVQRKRKRKFYNHIPAVKVRAFIGEQMWNSYYKFCFERNPWDRAISLYYWLYKTEPRPAMSEFLESPELLRLRTKGYDMYTIDGQIAVDRICRFENLHEELEAIRTQLGIPEELVLPHAQSEFREDKRSYRDILNVKQQAKIAELFSEEIRLFGYEF